MEMWGHRNVHMWGHGDMEIWGRRDVGMWGCGDITSVNQDSPNSMGNPTESSQKAIGLGL